MNYLIIALIWTGYCFIHSYMISIGFTKLMQQLLNKYYAFYRLFYVSVSILLLFPVGYYTGQLESKVVFTYHPPWSIIRYVLMGCSLLIFLKSFIFDYDSLSFFGIRQILNFKKKEKLAPEEGIKKSGLLGIVRHPMYFATILFFWCQTFSVSDIVTNSVITAYIIIGTKLEERKLVLEFGDSYVKYREEVPMLIPFTKLNHR
jgi:protein-S-isoprenylcysteine O-methyltransferase Ste14